MSRTVVLAAAISLALAACSGKESTAPVTATTPDQAGQPADASTNPFMATVLTILMFSLAGIPPMAGFFAKYFVFMAAIEAHLYALAIIGVLASVVGAYYYLRIIKVMWFDTPEFDVTTDKSPLEAKSIALAAAAFCFPLVIVALTWLEPLTRAAASGVGVG